MSRGMHIMIWATDGMYIMIWATDDMYIMIWATDVGIDIYIIFLMTTLKYKK